MLFIDEISEQISIMLHPGINIKSRSIVDALKYYYILSFVPLILSMLLIWIVSVGSTFDIMGLAPLVLFLWVIIPIILLINATILQLIGEKLLAFKGKYADTFAVQIYASCAVTLFLWLVEVGFSEGLALFWFWSLAVQTIRLSKLQKTGRLTTFAITIFITMVEWAVTLILLSLSINPGGSALIGTSCIASPGYICNNLSYSHSTGNVVFTIGQQTGANWASTAFMYAPQGTGATANAPAATFANVITTGLGSGQTTTISWGVAASTNVGATTAGSIWVCYTTTTGATVTPIANIGTCTASGSATVQYAQIATLTAKAV